MRPLYKIADEIERDWKNVNYAAIPYLDAMHTLTTMNDNYLLDNGESIVRYFLSNANSWRGEVARRVKAELRSML